MNHGHTGQSRKRILPTPATDLHPPPSFWSAKPSGTRSPTGSPSRSRSRSPSRRDDSRGQSPYAQSALRRQSRSSSPASRSASPSAAASSPRRHMSTSRSRHARSPSPTGRRRGRSRSPHGLTMRSARRNENGNTTTSVREDNSVVFRTARQAANDALHTTHVDRKRAVLDFEHQLLRSEEAAVDSIDASQADQVTRLNASWRTSREAILENAKEELERALAELDRTHALRMAGIHHAEEDRVQRETQEIKAEETKHMERVVSADLDASVELLAGPARQIADGFALEHAPRYVARRFACPLCAGRLVGSGTNGTNETLHGKSVTFAPNVAVASGGAEQTRAQCNCLQRMAARTSVDEWSSTELAHSVDSLREQLGDAMRSLAEELDGEYTAFTKRARDAAVKDAEDSLQRSRVWLAQAFEQAAWEETGRKVARQQDPTGLSVLASIMAQTQIPDGVPHDDIERVKLMVLGKWHCGCRTVREQVEEDMRQRLEDAKVQLEKDFAIRSSCVAEQVQAQKEKAIADGTASIVEQETRAARWEEQLLAKQKQDIERQVAQNVSRKLKAALIQHGKSTLKNNEVYLATLERHVEKWLGAASQTLNGAEDRVGGAQVLHHALRAGPDRGTLAELVHRHDMLQRRFRRTKAALRKASQEHSRLVVASYFSSLHREEESGLVA